MSFSSTSRDALHDLIREGKPPVMKPNGDAPHNSFYYVPVHDGYHRWYWDRHKQVRNDDGSVTIVKRETLQ